MHPSASQIHMLSSISPLAEKVQNTLLLNTPFQENIFQQRISGEIVPENAETAIEGN